MASFAVFIIGKLIRAILLIMNYPVSVNSLVLNVVSKIVSIVFVLSIVLFSGCKKSSDPKPTLSIDSFTPASGTVGTSVTITGLNFSATSAENVVTFNGAVAEISQASANQIIAVVPAGATTGKIQITVNGTAATSSTDFTVVVPDPPTVASFTPSSGSVGTIVTITGTFFSATPSDNVVSINGTSATVSTASATQLTVVVPAGATTGKIAVTVHELTATSTTDFTVLAAPTITSFTPTFYDQSTSLPTVTITGTNFSSTLADNVVKFNGTAATLSNATTTQLTMTLPSAATSGKITVTTNGLTATSATDFLIGCPDVIITDITVSNVVGNTFDITYHIKNIGGVPLNVNNMFFQGYLSQGSTLASAYVAAGGDVRYGYSQTYDLLAPNATLELHRNTISGGSITTYPYVVVEIVRELDGPIECDTNNNFLGQKIQ